MSKNARRLDGPHFTLSMAGDVYGDDTPENHDIVRRIHACVSACEGISTEELEQGIIKDMARAISQIVPLLNEELNEEPSSASSNAARMTNTATARPSSPVLG